MQELPRIRSPEAVFSTVVGENKRAVGFCNHDSALFLAHLNKSTYYSKASAGTWREHGSYRGNTPKVFRGEEEGDPERSQDRRNAETQTLNLSASLRKLSCRPYPKTIN